MSEKESIDEVRTLLVAAEDFEEFKRLDLYLKTKLEDLSRNFIKFLFEDGQITAEKGIKLKLNKLPSPGTVININIPPPPPLDALAEDIPLPILYEDEYLVLVNKPAGMVTHPAPGNYTGTLVNAILHHCPDLSGIGDAKRPGIVHRLDKGTSGVMVVAKTQKAHEGLVQLFSKHDIDRVYQALCIGSSMLLAGKLVSTIGRHPSNRIKMAVDVKNGREAITYYKVLERFENCTHLECQLETGRTHQIRVHMASLLKAAILCDATYGNPNQQLTRLPSELAAHLSEYPHPLLHARRLGFIHPITNEKIDFEVEPPEVFQKSLDLLRGLDD